MEENGNQLEEGDKMKIDVTYTVMRKMEVECHTYDEALEALMKRNWQTEGRVLNRQPTIIEKLVVDDSIALHDRTEGVSILKPKPLTEPITDKKQWKEELKKRTIEVQRSAPFWPVEKCELVAKEGMPPFPDDGWKK